MINFPVLISITITLLCCSSHSFAGENSSSSKTVNEPSAIAKMRSEQLELRATLTSKIQEEESKPSPTPSDSQYIVQLKDTLRKLNKMIADEESRAVAASFASTHDVGKELLYCAGLEISFKKLTIGVGHEYSLFKSSVLAEVKPIASLFIDENDYAAFTDEAQERAQGEVRGKFNIEMQINGTYRPYVEGRRQYCKSVRNHALWLTAP
jgi:hypothetical protein